VDMHKNMLVSGIMLFRNHGPQRLAFTCRGGK
jgi:hypothetical protein